MDVKIKKVVLLNAIFPILIGGIIYYLFSPNVIFVQKIDSLLGIEFHPYHFSSDMLVLKFIRNYLLDMLWGYSLIFAIFYVVGNKAVNVLIIGAVGAMFAGLMEFLQLTPLVGGIFDMLDILAELVAAALAVFIIKILLRRYS